MTRPPWTETIAFLATLFLASFAISSRSMAAPQNFVGCWDGTFAYNLANVLEVNDGFEITINGSQLSGDPIVTQDGITFVLQRTEENAFVWHTGLGLYVKIPPGGCRLDSANGTASCQASIPEARSYRSAFVTWDQSDIDFSGQGSSPIVPLATRGTLKSVEFSLSRTGASLVLTSVDEQGSAHPQSVMIEPFSMEGALICSMGRDSDNSFLRREFPDRLRTYLRRR